MSVYNYCLSLCREALRCCGVVFLPRQPELCRSLNTYARTSVLHNRSQVLCMKEWVLALRFGPPAMCSIGISTRRYARLGVGNLINCLRIKRDCTLFCRSSSLLEKKFLYLWSPVRRGIVRVWMFSVLAVKFNDCIHDSCSSNQRNHCAGHARRSGSDQPHPDFVASKEQLRIYEW